MSPCGSCSSLGAVGGQRLSYATGRDDVPGDWIVRAQDRDIVKPREVPQVRCRASATENRTVQQMPDRVRRCSQAASTQMRAGLVLGADEPESFGWILASGPSPRSP
jgi:hypothetical protein